MDEKRFDTACVKTPAFQRYRFSFRAVTPVRLPPFAGSAWRGAFGEALKRSICIMPNIEECQNCLLYRRCAFPELFAPPRPPDLPRRYATLPPPFVFAPEPGGVLEAGDAAEIELRLLAGAQRHLPYVVHALRRAAGRGMGARRGRLEMIGIEQWGGKDWRRIDADDGSIAPLADVFDLPPPQPPVAVRVLLLSPMRLKASGRNVPPQSLTAARFLMALVRRAYLLSVVNGETTEPDWAGLQKTADAVRLRPHDLGWRDIPRRSARQGRMRAGGIIGSFDLEGDLTPFWDHLWYGQWLHVGHLACMGLGAYRLQAAKLGKSATQEEAV